MTCCKTFEIKHGLLQIKKFAFLINETCFVLHRPIPSLLSHTPNLQLSKHFFYLSFL